MAEKQTSKDRMREIVDSIENGIKELFESDKYRKYLATMSRFHRYSVNNTMLIYMQRPDATHVAGFNKWRDQFGRNVLKGEKGIRIIAPTPYKKKVEEIKTDPETNAPVLDADGKAIIEEKEIRIPMFKVVSVFDVSQTAGKPLPQLAADLSGNVQQYEVFMEALRRASPVPIEIKPVAHDTDGFFSIKAQSITIRAGMSEVQTVCAAVHEIAHAKLHDYEHMTELADDGETILVPGEKSRNTEEVEAESISYAVCQYYGIETGENSFGYIATWSKGKELKELRASLETINKTASELITDIDRHFAEICRERGISVEKSEQAESQLKENSNMSAADLAKSISELYLDANGLAFLSEFASQEDCLQHFYEDLLTGADEIKGFLSETLEQSDEYAHRANELLLEVEAFQKSHTSLKELDANERWYAVDGGSKHLRITEDGAKYAYELYDKDTLHLLESGTVHDDDVNFLLAAAIRICETHGYDKTVPFEVLSNKFAGILYSLELSSDDNQVVHEEAGSRAAGTLPTSPELEQATPMPDPTLTVDDMRSYGYLDGEGGMDGVDLNSITPRLGWPYVSMMKDGVPGKARSGLDDAPGMLFGVYNYDKTVVIHNRGSAPTWVRGVFTAMGPGTVQNPKLIHGDAFVRVLYTMNPGDVVDIDTEKRIVRINGVNALNKIDKASSFGGMRVDPGYSVIGFDADTNPDQLSARVYFQIRYLGI